MSTIPGIKIPDRTMVRDLTGLIRDTEADLPLHHSTRVYLFGVNRLNFLRRYGIPEVLVETVRDAIALHTTPRIPEQKPEVALVTSEPDPAKSVLHQNSVVPEQAETQGFKYSNGSPGPPFSRGDNNLLRLAATFWVRDL